MYEHKYVRKRKTRIWVAIGAGISTTVVTTLAIISFLGRFVGTFTVRLETGTVALTLCEKSDFEDPTSYLRINQLPTFQECTYATLVERVGDDELDSETTGYLLGANYQRDGVTIRSLNYFKYTFFVKNVGSTDASYDLAINILDSKSDNGKSVEDTLRMMVYHNDDDSHTNRTVYAKETINNSYIDETGKVSYKERISTEEYGYAETFENNSTIATISEDNFEIGQITRYTLVMWLEGNDPESNMQHEAPKNARIKIGVEINAYEN